MNDGLLLTPSDERPPPVPDGQLRSPRKLSANGDPLVAQSLVGCEKDRVLLVTPRSMVDVRINKVVPPLHALVAVSSWNILCDLGPLLSLVLQHGLEKNLVLRFRPEALLYPLLQRSSVA